MPVVVNMVDKERFIRRVFKKCDQSRDNVNVAVACINVKCASLKQGKRKLSIRMDTDQAHCWVCGLKTHDSLIPLLRKVGTRSDIQEYLQKFAVSIKKQYRQEGDSVVEDEIIRLPDDYKVLAMHLQSSDPSVRMGLTYLKQRGLTERDLWFFKIGVSPNDPTFKRKVIFPSFDNDGQLNFFTARSVDKKVYPPYLMPGKGKVAIIFGEQNLRWDREITLVEGPFDLVKCDENSTCLMGSGLSEDYHLFWKIVENRTPVVLALDADAQDKSHKYARLLSSYDIPVRLLDVTGYKDVGEMTKQAFLDRKSDARSWEGLASLRYSISKLTGPID